MADSGNPPVNTLPPIRNGERHSLLSLFSHFDDDNRVRVKPSTADWYFESLQKFLKWFGKPGVAAEDLKIHDITRYCHHAGFTTKSSRKIKLSSLKRCFKWGKEQGLIQLDPLGTIKSSGGGF